MLHVQTGYWNKEEWENLDWPAFRAAWPKETPEEKPSSLYNYSHEKVRVTYEEAAALTALGCELTILPPVGMMVVKMSDRSDRADWDHGVSPGHIAEGKAIQIAVPDTALMYIDGVQVQEDFCTDALQEMLNEGWRILAICPPNAARRPDYILGRRKANDPFDRGR